MPLIPGRVSDTFWMGVRQFRASRLSGMPSSVGRFAPCRLGPVFVSRWVQTLGKVGIVHVWETRFPGWTGVVAPAAWSRRLVTCRVCFWKGPSARLPEHRVCSRFPQFLSSKTSTQYGVGTAHSEVKRRQSLKPLVWALQLPVPGPSKGIAREAAKIIAARGRLYGNWVRDSIS